MPKRFITQASVETQVGQEMAWPKDIQNHAQNVVRLRQGDTLEILTANAFLLSGIITATGIVIEDIQSTSAQGIHITLVPALFKWSRWEWMVEKAVELGVDAILPLQTEHSQIKVDGQSWPKRASRIEKIMREAQRQSLSTRHPNLLEPLPLPAYIQAYPDVGKLVAQPGDYPSVHHLDFSQFENRLHILTGPEGGFSQKEIALLQEHQAECIHLGPQILRAETAPMAILSIIRCGLQF